MLAKLIARSLLSGALLLFSVISFCQQRTVTGTILNSRDQSPISGATITIRGTSVSSVSDLQGKFSISIESNDAVLVISNVGYSTTEVPVNTSSTLEISLEQTALDLDAVVITGYTAQRKRNITGAVSSVSGKELLTNPSNNFAQKLQGKVAGVTVVNSSAPGGSVMVRIRGVGSVTGVNDPLYVVDGVPITGGLTEINPNDIEDLQILKDAAAASIYGSRANNGVVIVTTRKGKAGATKVSINAYTGVQKPYNFVNAVSPQQLAQITWDDYINRGLDPKASFFGQIGDGTKPTLPDYIIPWAVAGDPLTDPANYSRSVDGPGWLVNKFMITKANKEGTDWFKETTQNAKVQNYDLSVSGGTDKARYLISGGMYNQDGVIKYSYLKRYTIRANTEFNLSRRIKLGENLQFAYTKSNAVNGLYEDFGLLGKIANASPLQSVYDINGFLSGNRSKGNVPLNYNPVSALVRNKDNQNTGLRMLGNVYAEAELYKGLSFRSNLGVDYSVYTSNVFAPWALEDRLASQEASLTVNNNTNTSTTWTNQFTYNVKFGARHEIRALLGMEAIKGSYRNTSVTKADYAFEDVSYQTLSAGAKVKAASGGGGELRLASYFGKVDYVFDNKYLLSGTLRHDGSNRFAEDVRWGTFPAVSVGWITSDEKFMQGQKIFSLLKLRASWGITGNQEVDVNNQYTTYNSSPITSNYDINGTNNSIVQGFQAGRIGNPLGTWEEQTQTNIGLDAAFLENKLSFTIDVYKRSTDKLLLVLPSAATGGVNQQPATNVGKMENRGIDLSLNYNGKSGKDFSYSVGAIWSTYKNEVTELYNGDKGFIQINNQRVGTLSRTQQGHPIGEFWGYINNGIFQSQKQADDYPTQNGNRSLYNQPGRFFFANTNGDSVINSQDLTFIGSPHPKFTYGLTINLQYKSFDVNLFLQGVYGNKLFNFLKFETDFLTFPSGLNQRILDSWTPTNTDAILPKLNSNAAGWESQANTYFVEDGSYLRGKTLAIGYNLPGRLLAKIHSTNARFYVQGTNLFTITKYQGIDPEVTVQSPGAGADLQFGLDRGIYPFSRSFQVGLQLGF